MKSETFVERMIRILWRDPIGKIQYYFAKEWLNNTFGWKVGRKEYWGEYLQNLIEKVEENPLC
jgi:hypothetical protein